VLVTTGKTTTYRMPLHAISRAPHVTEQNGFNLRFRWKPL
jgi:hypothetical protein